ncbi:NAAT family transporter [Parvularcula flava]|uniref:UPF0056 membrane protein n=1 Tax=Aquisalinus luteolus TaxID=1566827 RepID=A0ABX0HN49_9PROT|nr:MarC family protein [Aquisalinus luteolus]NHK28082.1 NAAT family transporter [Aquisalinus luteolus]
MDVEFFTRFLAAMFAIMNPLVVMPIFLSMTEDYDNAYRRRIAFQAATTILAASIVVALAGQPILDFFGISINAFRIAGGILLFQIALTMISGVRHEGHAGTDREKRMQEEIDNPAVYPLAIPMSVGPGTITTLILFSQQAAVNGAYIELYAVIFIMAALMCVGLLIVPFVNHVVSYTARTVSIRIMGIILAAMATEMIITGIRNAGIFTSVAS